MSEIITLAMTGASGAQYGIRLLECLVSANRRIFFMVSKAAQVVLETETDLVLHGSVEMIQQQLTDYTQAKPGQITVFGQNDWMSPVASGSGAATPLVICPCSSGTLSSIAYGASNNLIERAADVALKERRQLILVTRESPLSMIHLENMLKLTKMGAVILPASPGFYNKPATINDLIDFVVARILKQLTIDQHLTPDWGGHVT